MHLWDFALALYARPGVEDACLTAQADGADVCLLLCGAWLDWQAQPYQTAYAQALQTLAEQRQTQLIKPLRALRQHLRSGAAHNARLAQLRTQVKTLELEAERQLLEQLQQMMQTRLDQRSEPTGNWLSSLAKPLKANHPTLALLRMHSAAL